MASWKCPEPQKIPYHPDNQYVYLDAAWAGCQWPVTMLQLNALHEGDTLDLFLKPSHFENVDENRLLQTTGLQWDGSTLKKHGKVVSALEPLVALEQFLAWLKKRKPVILISFNYAFNDSMHLVRLFESCKLIGEFKKICLGFISTCADDYEIQHQKKSRNDYMKGLLCFEPIVFPDAHSLKLLLESKRLPPSNYHTLSVDLDSLMELQLFKERLYYKRCTYRPLYEADLIEPCKARLLAYHGYTLEDLSNMFLKHGPEKFEDKLREILTTPHRRHWFYNALGLLGLYESDIRNICKYFVTIPARCPAPRRIPSSPEASLVYVDFAFTGRKWSDKLVELSALHEEEELNLFVNPTSSTDFDAETLVNRTDLQWDGKSLMKNGDEIPSERVLQPSKALEHFISWLEERKPAIILGFNYSFNDSLHLMRLLKTYDLFQKFREVCLGFINIQALTRERRIHEKSRMDYLREILGSDDATLPNPLSLKLLVESHTTSLNERGYYRCSYDFECLDAFENWREDNYNTTLTFEPLYNEGVISKHQARRLAIDGVTFQDLKDIYSLDGDEGVTARLRAVRKGFAKRSAFLITVLQYAHEIEEEDIERVCEFLAVDQ